MSEAIQNQEETDFENKSYQFKSKTNPSKLDESSNFEMVANNKLEIVESNNNNSPSGMSAISDLNGKMKPVPIYSLQKKFTFKACVDKLIMIWGYLVFATLLIAFDIVYFNSLEYRRCDKVNWLECRIKYEVSDFLNVSFKVIISAYILSVLLLALIILKKKKLLGVVALNCFIIFLYDHDYIIQSHGGYNRNYCLLLTIFFMGINFLIVLFAKLFYKRYVLGVFLLTTMLYLSYIGIEFYIFKYSCKDFKKGLMGIEISQANDKCVTPVPKYCTFYLLDGIFDLPYWFNQDCAEEKGNMTLLFMNSNFDKMIDYNKFDKGNNGEANKYFSTIIKKVGFPNSILYNRTDEVTYGNAQPYVLQHLINLDNVDISKQEKIEYTLNYNEKTNEYEPEINLKYNATLAEERKKVFEKKFESNKNEYENNKKKAKPTPEGQINFDELKLKPFTKNVLTIFFDATSRRHFFRKFPRLMKWFEKHYNSTDSKLSSYQFMKHQTIYPGTLANMGAAYWGTYNKGSGIGINKKFKQHGYITGATNNMCSAEVIDIKKSDPTRYEMHPNDHELWTPFCDPNQQSMLGPYVDFKGPYSVLKKCMWGKQSIDHSLEYAKQFFQKYKDNHKIFRIGTADDHETSAEVIRYLDDPLVDFLEGLEKDGTLEETTLILFSDHGTYSNGWVHRKYETPDYEIEMCLPGLFVVIPKSVKNFKIIDDNMRSKEHMMTNAFDVYKTMYSTIDGSEQKETFVNYGKGLLYNHFNVTKTFDCDYYGTTDIYCMCRKRHNVTNY